MEIPVFILALYHHGNIVISMMMLAFSSNYHYVTISISINIYI